MAVGRTEPLIKTMLQRMVLRPVAQVPAKNSSKSLRALGVFTCPPCWRLCRRECSVYSCRRKDRSGNSVLRTIHRSRASVGGTGAAGPGACNRNGVGFSVNRWRFVQQWLHTHAHWPVLSLGATEGLAWPHRARSRLRLCCTL